MAYGQWIIGLDLQSGVLRAVGLQRQRHNWRLCRWWHIPFDDTAAEFMSDGYIAQASEVLKAWRNGLPRGYQLRVAFPAGRTLQQPIPTPDFSLREDLYQQYVEQRADGSVAFSPQPMAWDFPDPPFGGEYLTATGARQADIAQLLGLLRRCRLSPFAITPDASVLPVFRSLLVGEQTYLIHREADYWLWASDDRWGMVQGDDDRFQAWCTEQFLTPDHIALSSVLSADRDRVSFSPWQAITGLTAPLPACASQFTVATGLALGVLPR